MNQGCKIEGYNTSEGIQKDLFTNVSFSNSLNKIHKALLSIDRKTKDFQYSCLSDREIESGDCEFERVLNELVIYAEDLESRISIK